MPCCSTAEKRTGLLVVLEEEDKGRRGHGKEICSCAFLQNSGYPSVQRYFKCDATVLIRDRSGWSFCYSVIMIPECGGFF